jgi:hypothetical protein
MTYSESHNTIVNAMALVSHLSQRLVGLEQESQALAAQLAAAQQRVAAVEIVAAEQAWDQLGAIKAQVDADLAALKVRADQLAANVGRR